MKPGGDVKNSLARVSLWFSQFFAGCILIHGYSSHLWFLELKNFKSASSLNPWNGNLPYDATTMTGIYEDGLLHFFKIHSSKSPILNGRILGALLEFERFP